MNRNPNWWGSEFDELCEFNSLKEIPRSAFTAQYLERMVEIQQQYGQALVDEARAKGWAVIGY